MANCPGQRWKHDSAKCQGRANGSSMMSETNMPIRTSPVNKYHVVPGLFMMNTIIVMAGMIFWGFITVNMVNNTPM
jgi:hypothetical protein